MAGNGRLRKHDPIADEITSALIDNDNETIIELLKSSSIDILDGDARTPLINASLCNNIEIILYLINNGANINHQDRKGLSALLGAVIHRNIDIIEILLKNNADVNILDCYGNNPLWRATHNACLKTAAEKEYKIVEILLKNNGNPYNKNNNGKTPFEISERRIEIKRLFNE